MKRLNQIESRVNVATDLNIHSLAGEYGMRTLARQDVPDMLSALRDTLDLHRLESPWVDSMGQTVEPEECITCSTSWPCLTVQKIYENLGETPIRAELKCECVGCEGCAAEVYEGFMSVDDPCPSCLVHSPKTFNEGWL